MYLYIPVLLYRQHNKEFVRLAQSLCDEALALGSGDNVTVQIVDLKYVGGGEEWATSVTLSFCTILFYFSNIYSCQLLLLVYPISS